MRRLIVLSVLASVLLASPAGASSATPPYSDPNAKGTITLCDAKGAAITSGSVATTPFTARAVSSIAATGPYANGYRTAILMAYQPQQGLLPSEWSGEALTASTRYSNPAHPMTQATSRDLSLATFLEDFPARWDGWVQLRIYLGTADAPQFSQNYPAVNLKVTGSTWVAVDAGSTSCTSGKAISTETLLLHNHNSGSTTTTTGSTSSSSTGSNTSTTGSHTSTSGTGTSSTTHHSPRSSAWMWAVAAIVVLALVGLVLSRRGMRRGRGPSSSASNGPSTEPTSDNEGSQS